MFALEERGGGWKVMCFTRAGSRCGNESKGTRRWLLALSKLLWLLWTRARGEQREEIVSEGRKEERCKEGEEEREKRGGGVESKKESGERNKAGKN